MLSVFGDESHDPTNARVFAVAGLLGDGNQWASFRQEWNARLNGLVFHAADCEPGYGHFRGMPETHRHRLHRDLTRMVAESGLVGYGYVIDLAGCRAVVPDVLKEFPDMPYYDCFLKTVIKLSDFAAHLIPKDRVEFTFDQHKETQYNAGLKKIHETLKLMGKPAESALSGETARDLCERVGAKAMLTGTIASLGSQYVLSLRAEGCANGEALDNQQEQASGKDQVLKTLSDMAGKFRARAGESLAAIREHNVPLEEGTTSSLEALKAYTASINQTGEASESQLRRATELDPEFAAAWSLLAIHYSNLGETALSRQSAIRAYQARERASGPEKFNIEYSYDRNVTGNLEKAWQSISLWRQTYPRDPKAFSLSGGYAANGTGRFEQVVAESAKSVDLDPDHLYGYTNGAVALFHLGRFEEAEKAFAVAAAHHATTPDLLASRYRLALLKRDKAGMERILAESRGSQDSEIAEGQVQALAAARDGRLNEAEKYSRGAIEMAIRAELRERTAVFQAAPAVWNALYEKKGAARSTAETALKTFEGRDVAYAAGFALGLGGDAAKAEALAGKLDKEYPEDTQVQATYVPTLRALAALDKNDPRKAIDLLEANRPYEFGIPPVAFNHFYGNMYPIYVRGLAYLMMRNPTEAAVEFNRLLAHPGLYAGDPVEAAARRQLARVLELTGDNAKARSAYEDFLALWKDADSDIPILKQAKAEYAKLQ